MTGKLAGRVAVITGAGTGIGKGIAEAYACEGANVLIADVNEKTGTQVAEDLRNRHKVGVEFIRTDVTDEFQVVEMIEGTVKHFGRLDVLVNNAWKGTEFARLEDTGVHLFREGFEIGAFAAIWTMQAAFNELKKHGTGRVINIASLNGVNAHMYSAPYNMAKESLRTLTRTAAREWAQHQIACNIICPAAKSDGYKEFSEKSPENATAIEAGNPMGRIGDPLNDIGPVAVFLGSEDCRYVTGNTMYVDGGAHINGVQWVPNVD